jgi:hypothetical protein
MKQPGTDPDKVSRAQKRILLYLVLPSVALYLGLRFYAQYRPVDIYVSQTAPMPKELAAGLHMEEHKINPMATIETPYERAADKKLSMEEIHRLRSQIAWSRAMPPLVDSLTIQSRTQVLARHTTRRFMLEYQLVKREGQWLIENATRSEIQRPGQ